MNRVNEMYYKEHYTVEPEKPEWYDIRKDARFSVHGLYHYASEIPFKRLPDRIGKNTNEGVSMLYTNTAGGRIRFRTDSRYIAIRCTIPNVSHRSVMSLLNSAGFDVYLLENQKETYRCSIYPPIDLTDGYEKLICLGDTQEREITVYMPLYNDITDIHIGLAPESSVKRHTEYRHPAPILYYGSSITQGASVSRPGLTYQSILCRRFDADYINLGFASSARAEDIIVNYMAEMNFGIFVSDYDYNAPTPEHLKNTHEKMYRTIRNAHPDTPYIMLSKPILTRDANCSENYLRRDIVYDTYQKACDDGDKNVYFIDGFTIADNIDDGCGCADGVHPNDLGAYLMAEKIGAVLQRIL